jgi:preprotein translocase subunit SecG
MQTVFQLATIILSILLIILILFQVKGDALGSILGGEGTGGIARTRRGLERTLFQLTIGLSAAFLVICILSVVTYNG